MSLTRKFINLLPEILVRIFEYSSDPSSNFIKLVNITFHKKPLFTNNLRVHEI